jgi:hypothetical protein
MTFYLNNSGHRWVNLNEGKREKLNVFFPENNSNKSLTVHHWEAIGNFAVPYVRQKGKQIQLMPSSKKEGFWVENNEINRANRI